MTHGNTFRQHSRKADVHRVRVGKRYWLFTFSDQWGPLLTDEWGEPVDNTPLADEEHPFWDKFEAWLADRSPIGASPAPSPTGYMRNPQNPHDPYRPPIPVPSVPYGPRHERRYRLPGPRPHVRRQAGGRRLMGLSRYGELTK